MIQSRDHFPQWLTEHGLTGTGVEVGTYFGAYAEYILKNWPGRLICVDPYENYPKEEYLDGCNSVDLQTAMEHALGILMPFGDRFMLIRSTSLDVASGSSGCRNLSIEDSSLDFVYLDGNHDYKHVTDDIRAWWPKVKSGGVLGGHDYYERDDAQQRCHVQLAVNDWCRESDHSPLVTNCSSWWIFKT